MLDINASELEHITLIEASGRVDSMNANQLGEALSDAIDQVGVCLVLDLAGVGYMSSAGLREIVSALKKVKREEGDLRLARPSERVREVLEMSGLDTIFKIFATQDEAIDSY